MHGGGYLGPVSTPSDWPAYVSSLGSTARIAAAAGVNFSTAARWKSGANPPSPEKVISLARAMEHSPLDALIAAGYLQPDEVEDGDRSVPRAYALREYSDLELAKEAVRRIEHGSDTTLLEQPLDEQHPAMDELAGRRRSVSDLSDDELSRLDHAAGTDETQPDEE